MLQGAGLFEEAGSGTTRELQRCCPSNREVLGGGGHVEVEGTTRHREAGDPVTPITTPVLDTGYLSLPSSSKEGRGSKGKQRKQRKKGEKREKEMLGELRQSDNPRAGGKEEETLLKTRGGQEKPSGRKRHGLVMLLIVRNSEG